MKKNIKKINILLLILGLSFNFEIKSSQYLKKLTKYIPTNILITYLGYNAIIFYPFYDDFENNYKKFIESIDKTIKDYQNLNTRKITKEELIQIIQNIHRKYINYINNISVSPFDKKSLTYQSLKLIYIERMNEYKFIIISEIEK